MIHSKIPETDSIRELASFWDTHDLTDFEDQLEEVTEPGNLLVFTSEKTEGAGGLRARLRYEFLSESVCKLALDLARPGEEFRECQLVEMTRVN